MPHLHQVIYLDCDTLCRKPLNLPPVEKIAACYGTGSTQEGKNLVAEYLHYFNPGDPRTVEAGVLMLNVDWMREVDFIRRLYAGLEKWQPHYGRFFFAENMGIFERFKDDITELPLKYNAGWRDLKAGFIAEEDIIIYHLHQEQSGVRNKVRCAHQYVTGGPLVVVWISDNETANIARLEHSVASVRKYNPCVRTVVVSTTPLRGNFINFVRDIPANGYLDRRHLTRHSRANRLKFLLPTLPFERVIYLDTDTLCRGSLAPLWAMTRDHAICAVNRASAPPERAGVRVESNGESTYYSMGVLALNLEKLRAMRWQERFAAYNAQCGAPPFFYMADETMFNDLFRDEITPVGGYYNTVCEKGEPRGIIAHYPSIGRKRYFYAAAVGGVVSGQRVEAAAAANLFGLTQPPQKP
jgi:lipopolysaccharide biosynthesis glycosyltransferase